MKRVYSHTQPMRIAHSKTFRSGNSEAVRLPKGFGFGIGVDVEIVREDDRVVIQPRRAFTGKDLVDALNALPLPKTPLKREPILFPKRPGLR